jgi:hypothetical protein
VVPAGDNGWAESTPHLPAVPAVDSDLTEQLSGRLGSGGTLQRTMENTAPLGKRVIAWIVVIVAALLALKLIAGAVIGLVALILTIALIVAAVMAVMWALRHL